MKLGYIPNKTVNDTNINKIKNSLLLRSGMLTTKNLEYDPPNAILWYMYIVYAAENTIEELAKAPKRGNLSNAPYKHKNSPIKLSDRGVPALLRQSIKNNMEKIGINWVIPL